MRYLSVCSGIEAATVAWHGLGWKPVAFSEIEAFPSAVLAHHYPDVPNVGDMTKYKEWNLGAVDLLVGGTPCQSFSVAGLRKGLEDPRGNLALVYCGILDHFRPKWFVWENVPGVLSSGGGRDFGSFVGALAELGYGFAYRVLDAQYFGVAQRRRRVFVVGHLGDWRPAAEVLFESESLRRDTAPSRKAGQAVAPCVTNGPPFSRTGNERVEAEAMVVQPFPVANTLTARMHKGMNSDCNEGQTPVVAIQGNLIGREAGGPQGVGASDEGVMYTLTKADVHGVAHPTVLMDQGGSVMNVLEDGTVGTLRRETHGHEPVVMQPVAYSFDSLASNSMKSSNPHSGCRMVDLAKTIDTTTPEPSKNQGGIGIMQSMAVRRLTPVECERLQGFADQYTSIPWRKSQVTPDGPRYKALGNSMAVPVMAWIGKRIKEVNA
jgi:DNA (cytosine-5)-methyltransferase 1